MHLHVRRRHSPAGGGEIKPRAFFCSACGQSAAMCRRCTAKCAAYIRIISPCAPIKGGKALCGAARRYACGGAPLTLQVQITYTFLPFSFSNRTPAA